MSIRRTGVLLALLALTIAACSPGPGTGGQLEGTRWVLNSYSQDDVLTILPEQLYADARFDASRVSGFSGCNEFNALYRAGGRTLLVSQPASTLMACDEAAMAFEAQFLTLLQASRFYSVRGDTLTVFGAVGDGPLLVFDAAPRNPLLGKWNVESFGVPPSTVVAVLPETEIDVVFGIGTVGGFAGCNSFSGTYGTNGTIVRISRLATTRMACDEAVMEQETAFIEALQGAALVDIPRLHPELHRPQGRDRRRPRKAPAARARRERQSNAERDARGDTHPDGRAHCDANAHTQADGRSDTHTKPDAQADGRSDTDARADRGADGPADGGPAHDRPADRLVQAVGSRGAGGCDDRLSRDLVHGDRARRPGVPLLRCGAHHGTGRPRDARHARSGGRVCHAVPGCRDRGD